MTYKGHSATIEFDAEDRLFFGRLNGIEVFLQAASRPHPVTGVPR